MTMYKYINKMQADLILSACPCTDEGQKNIWLAFFDAKDYINIAYGKWENVSPACKARMGYKDNKKHIRFRVKTTTFKKYALSCFGNDDKKYTDAGLKISIDEWNQYKAKAKEIYNQNNDGYALELAIEDIFNVKVEKHGIDLPEFDGKRVEIKWSKGGQMVL